MHRQLRLHVAAVLAWLAAFGVLVFTGMLVWLYLKEGKVPLPLLVFGLGGLLAAHIGGLLLAHGLRCVVCGQAVFHVSPPNRPDPRAKRFLGFSFRLQVAREILTKEHYHCIHCHSVCRSRRQISAQAAATSEKPNGKENPFMAQFQARKTAEVPSDRLGQVFGDILPLPGRNNPAEAGNLIADNSNQYSFSSVSPSELAATAGEAASQAESTPEARYIAHPERPPWSHHGSLSPFTPPAEPYATNHEFEMNPVPQNSTQFSRSGGQSPFEAMNTPESQEMATSLAALFGGQVPAARPAVPAAQNGSLTAPASPFANAAVAAAAAGPTSPFRPATPAPAHGASAAASPFSASPAAMPPQAMPAAPAVSNANPFSVFGPPPAEPKPELDARFAPAAPVPAPAQAHSPFSAAQPAAALPSAFQAATAPVSRPVEMAQPAQQHSPYLNGGPTSQFPPTAAPAASPFSGSPSFLPAFTPASVPPLSAPSQERLAAAASPFSGAQSFPPAAPAPVAQVAPTAAPQPFPQGFPGFGGGFPAAQAPAPQPAAPAALQASPLAREMTSKVPLIKPAQPAVVPVAPAMPPAPVAAAPKPPEAPKAAAPAPLKGESESQSAYEAFLQSVADARKAIDTALANVTEQAANLRGLKAVPVQTEIAKPAAKSSGEDYDRLLAQAFANTQQAQQPLPPKPKTDADSFNPFARSAAEVQQTSPAPRSSGPPLPVAPMPFPQSAQQHQPLPLPQDLVAPVPSSPHAATPFDLSAKANTNGAPAFETLQMLSAQILEQTERAKRREQQMNEAPPPPFDFLSAKGDSYILKEKP
jgi:hypothetical protein